MEKFGGLFGIFLIIAVTLAQIAGNNKRNRDKGKDVDPENLLLPTDEEEKDGP